MSRRPTKDEYFLGLAQHVSSRSTCLRRSVGCVLVNMRGHVLATGYNGVAAGITHCNDEATTQIGLTSGGRLREYTRAMYQHACAGAWEASGKNLEKCEAIHAEQNALLQCRDVYDVATCYVTVSPCVTCVKLLLNTTCQRIVFSERYAHDEVSAELWLRVRGQTYHGVAYELVSP